MKMDGLDLSDHDHHNVSRALRATAPTEEEFSQAREDQQKTQEERNRPAPESGRHY